MKKALWLLLGLTGCMVGPDYHPPTVWMPNTFTEAKEVVKVDDSFFEWWKRFEDPVLNELLLEAAQRNFDLRIAMEVICQARAQFMISVANLFPQISFDFFATRSRNSQSQILTRVLPTFQDFYLLGFDAVWQIDLFGGLTRAKRAAFFQWQTQAELARNTQLVVLSETALQYTLIRALQQKLNFAQEVASLDQKELGFIEDQFQAGLASNSQVEAVRLQLASDTALTFSLQSLVKQGIYALAPLVGRPPESLVDLFQTIAPVPQTMGKIPAALPSELLLRRPDIRAAERNLAAATEEIGVAVANLFPQVSLTSNNLFGSRLSSSNYGFSSNSVGNLLEHVSNTWGIGVAVFQTIFDFGRAMEAIQVQTSAQKQALINYQKTVVVALKEVESALVAYFQEQERLIAVHAQVEAARKRVVFTEDYYQSGLGTYAAFLEAKREWLNNTSTLIDSEQALASNLIAVYKALGGEWACYYLP